MSIKEHSSILYAPAVKSAQEDKHNEVDDNVALRELNALIWSHLYARTLLVMLWVLQTEHSRAAATIYNFISSCYDNFNPNPAPNAQVWYCTDSVKRKI